MADSQAVDLIEISDNKQPTSGVKHHFVNARASSRAKALHPRAQRRPIDAVPLRNSVGCNSVDLGEITSDVHVNAVRKQIPHNSVCPSSDRGPGATIPLCQICDRQARISESAAHIKTAV